MAKDKAAAQPVKGGDQAAKAADALRIRIEVDGIKQVTVDCEPGDLEKYWARPTPGEFLCEDGAQYTFQVPAQIGFASFKRWFHPRTKGVLGSDPKLVLTPTKRNERYVAVYEQAQPIDVLFHGTTPKEEVVIQATEPDINGRTEITTPGRFTYMKGAKVTFSTPAGYKTSHPDVLYGKIEQEHNFLRWEEGAVTVGKDRHIRLTLDNHRNLRVLYGKSPVPKTPNDREVNLLSQPLFRVVDRVTPDQGVVILINGKLMPLFGRVTFPNKKNAMAALQTAVLQSIPNWIAQTPEGWRDWLRVETQREKFLDHWYKTAVQIVPLNKLQVTVSEEPKS